MKEKKRIIWIELLRITACFAVVVAHMGSQHFRDVPVESFTWAVSNVYHGIPRFSVGCFVMISGALYLDKCRRWDLKKLFFKNILPIGVVYIFWQVFYAIYRSIVGNIPIFSVEFVKSVLSKTGEAYFHLWYLPMLLGLLILTPILWEMINCENGEKWEEYMLIIFLIFKVANVTIGFLPLPQKSYVNSYMDTIQPELITGYVGYYILGHYLYHYGLPKKLERAAYVLGVSGIIVGILMCHYFSLKTGKPVQAHYQNFTFVNIFWSSAVFLFFQSFVSRIEWNEKNEKLIFRISGCTLGIYLVHALIRDIFARVGIQTMIFNEIFSIPILAAIIFVITYWIVLGIKKIPVVGKWIV